MLTDYARLPEFVPNIALSEQIPLAPGSPANLVRLRQVNTIKYLVVRSPNLFVQYGASKYTTLQWGTKVVTTL